MRLHCYVLYIARVIDEETTFIESNPAVKREYIILFCPRSTRLLGTLKNELQTHRPNRLLWVKNHCIFYHIIQ